MPFGVELLQLLIRPGHEPDQVYKSPVPFGVELLQLMILADLRGNGNGVMSPVPFGVELLQLGIQRDQPVAPVPGVTSAFRRGASSAGSIRGQDNRYKGNGHQCLSAWSFFS